MQIQYILVIAIVLQELQTYNLIWTFRDFFSKSNSDNIALYTKKLTKPQKLKLHMYLFFLQRLQQVYCEACLVIKITIQVEKNASSLLRPKFPFVVRQRPSYYSCSGGREQQ